MKNDKNIKIRAESTPQAQTGTCVGGWDGHEGAHQQTNLCVHWRPVAGPVLPPSTPRIQEFWNAQAEWSQATFGQDSERDHIGPLKHLAKEAVEAQVRPADPVEIADCLFLVFDAARRSGMTLDTLIKVAEQKLLVNKARKWNRPTDDNPVEHVRVPPTELQVPSTPGKNDLERARLTFFYIRNLTHDAWRDPPNLEAVCQRIEGYATMEYDLLGKALEHFPVPPAEESQP